MPELLTTKDIVKRIRAVHGTSIKMLDAFEGYKEKNLLKCTECGHEWHALVRNVVFRKSGCPVCSKAKQASNISKGHSNSRVREEKYKIKIAKLEEMFDITFIGKLPTAHTDKCKFECNPCGHIWSNQLRTVASSKVGCPACGEEERLRKSNTPEILAARSALSSLSTEEARKRILKGTFGRTLLISEWRGANKPRRFSCNLCKNEWRVNKSSDGMLTQSLCKLCVTCKGHSSIAIMWLEQEAKRRRIKIKHARNGGEYKLPGTNIRVDGYNARSKTVFEFHGDSYHGNPKVYYPNSRPNPFSNSRASVLYKRTKAREKRIRELGYNLVVMWEHDYKALLKQRYA